MSGQVTGKRFEVKLQWTSLTFFIYASTEITFNANGHYLEASGPFTGSIRAAGFFGDKGLVAPEILDLHAGRIPKGGSISSTVEGDVATMKFNWIAEGDGDLLMMALPHHAETLKNPGTTHSSRVVKGLTVGYTGDTWIFEEPLTTIGWNSPRPLPAGKKEVVRAALADDIANTGCCSDDPYFGGKKMAKLARLSLIADELGETSLATQARERIKPFIEGWLGGTNGDKLVYDSTWGGVVSLNGLNDQHADFGNGMYNDHHFHYGYHIYAAAVMAKADSAWGAKWDDAVVHMISDVAEPSRASEWYPFQRSKDWYDGHSWASGLFTFADGKNMESTSESVNVWYAIYLYGLARENTRLKDLGRLMTALEIRSAKNYWQMTTLKSNFPAPFSDNKVVGIQWSAKVDYATWFGNNVEYIHCIQVIRKHRMMQ